MVSTLTTAQRSTRHRCFCLDDSMLIASGSWLPPPPRSRGGQGAPNILAAISRSSSASVSTVADEVLGCSARLRRPSTRLRRRSSPFGNAFMQLVDVLAEGRGDLSDRTR